MAEKAQAQVKPAAISAGQAASGSLQRKCACGTHTTSEQCDSCKGEGGLLQRKASSPTDHSRVPSIVHEVLRSPGQPLDAGTRAFFEPRFGQDFSHVRVHTDAKASASARAVDARAYTISHNIVLASGQYSPTTLAGKKLLAHELTHVAQQTGKLQRSSIVDHPKITVGSEDDRFEREADEVAEKIIRNEGAPALQQAKSARLQRAPAIIGLDDAGPKAKLVDGDKEAELLQCIKTRGPDPEECDPKVALTWADFQGTPDPTSRFGAVTASAVNPQDVPTQVCMQLVLGKTTGATRRFRAKLNSASAWVLDSVKYPADLTKNGCAPLITQCENHFNGGGTLPWGLRPAGNCAASVPFRGDTARSAAECTTKVGLDCKDRKVAESARLLKHEQGHFNISCAIAKKANVAMAQGTAERTIHQAVITKRSAAQTSYDNDTSHGCVAAQQASWEGDIANGLPNITIP